MNPLENPQAFARALFDLRFTKFITTKIVPILFILGCIAIAMSYLTAVVTAFSHHVSTGLLVMLVVGPVMSLIYVVFLRVLLEVVIVLFRILENTQVMARDASR